MQKFKILFLIISFSVFFSCNSEENTNNNNNNNTNNNLKNNNTDNPITVSIVSEKDKYTIGDKIDFKVIIKDNSENDSVIVMLNDKKTDALAGKIADYQLDTKDAKTGGNFVEFKLIRDSSVSKSIQKVTLISDIKPKNYSYKIKKTYKHDVNAYTQGLFYKDGFLYEATGLKGQSTVRKVKFETGEVLQSFAIPTDVFGEGITFHDGKIIQISWEAERGFVYDFTTFKQLQEFQYTGQGWGITSDGEKLYMSNGSHEIKILEPQSLSVFETLEVYDNDGRVVYLNEMEFVDGEVYANIYNYEKIVRFDPKTGKVLGYIDLSGILPMSDFKSNTDVLNGIAYDKAKNRLFVTGKNWPKLFEIELVEK